MAKVLGQKMVLSMAPLHYVIFNSTGHWSSTLIISKVLASVYFGVRKVQIWDIVMIPTLIPRNVLQVLFSFVVSAASGQVKTRGVIALKPPWPAFVPSELLQHRVTSDQLLNFLLLQPIQTAALHRHQKHPAQSHSHLYVVRQLILAYRRCMRRQTRAITRCAAS